jgi:hypothetical protein
MNQPERIKFAKTIRNILIDSVASAALEVNNPLYDMTVGDVDKIRESLYEKIKPELIRVEKVFNDRVKKIELKYENEQSKNQ